MIRWLKRSERNLRYLTLCKPLFKDCPAEKRAVISPDKDCLNIQAVFLHLKYY